MCIHSYGPQEYNYGMLQLMQIQSKFALAMTSHNYILGAHMNKSTMLNDAIVFYNV